MYARTASGISDAPIDRAEPATLSVPSGALPFLSESDKFTKTLLEFVGRVTKKK